MRSWLILALLVLAGCIEPVQVDDRVAAPPDAPTRFLVVGDTGTGGEAQYAVARAMEEVCARDGCEFAVVLGDAIYESGVSGPDDPQFHAKFEAPYANFTIPFWMVLGNHDYGGAGERPEKGQYYVDYARTSDRWTMPDLYYSFTHGPVSFFALDSGAATIHATPANVPLGPIEAQAAWLEAAVAASHSPWKMTLAHHPYISNGQHGDAGSYDGVPQMGQAWKSLLERGACGKVDLMLAGHDHDLQWLAPTEACGDTQFIISGAGAKQRSRGSDDHPALFERYDGYGFVWMNATAEALDIRFYDDTASLLHAGTMTR